MLSAVADVALRRPRAVLAAVVALLVLCAALAAAAPDRLALAPARSDGSESSMAADELRGKLGHEPAPDVVIVTRGGEAVRSGVYQVALDVTTSQVEARSEVAEVRRAPTSRDGRSTALEVYFRDDDPRAEQAVAAELGRELDPGPLDVLIGGEAGVADDARTGLWAELGPLELLALPVTVIVLLIAFGLRLAAGPAIAAAIGTLGSLGVMGLVNEATPLSISALAPAAVIAVALAIESCHLLAARYRDGLASLPNEDAVRNAVEVTGRAIVIATLVAAAVATSLAVIPVLDARSAGLGGALAAVLSGAVSLVAMPSLLVLFGTRPGAEEASGPAPQARERGVWYRLESALTARRLGAAALVVAPVAALIVLAAPGLRTDTVPLDSAGLPGDSEARRAEVAVISQLGSEVTAPVLRSADEDPARVAKLDWKGLEARPGSLGARGEIEAIREREPPAVEVGGRDAEALDANRELLGHLPFAAGGAALMLAVVLVMFVFRSVLPLGRAIAAAVVLAVGSKLPAAAATGLLVLTFQDGRLTGLLGYTPEGGPELVAVVAVVAAVATVSVTRTVHFAATIAHGRALGLDAAERVPSGAALTLPGVAASTAVLASATIVLAGADLLAAKQFGLATAAGLVLDLVLLRVLLAPGLARLSQ
ncbi:MAG: MMPL family transporter [Solirubrobacterales bacterium]